MMCPGGDLFFSEQLGVSWRWGGHWFVQNCPKALWPISVRPNIYVELVSKDYFIDLGARCSPGFGLEPLDFEWLLERGIAALYLVVW